jgi:subtilisin family serine protease
MSGRYVRLAIGALLPLATLAVPSLATAAPTAAQTAGSTDRYIVVARSDADYDNLRAAAQRAGASVVQDIREGGMFVVNATPASKATIAASGLAKGVAKDHVETIVPPSAQPDLLNTSGLRSKTQLDASASAAVAAASGRNQRSSFTPDPGFFFPGLMWDLPRINAPQAWQVTSGSPAVRVGVADTGLDFTHAELASQVAQVVDFSDPTLCPQLFPSTPFSDADLAAQTGGPATGDFFGHGSWIGGNIAAALNGEGVNGIAPHVKLVSLKIAQWCGFADDSTILSAFIYAGNHNIDVVSISFGGYLDLSQPDQALIWGQYNQVVQRLRDQGTVVVAASGNEHLQIGTAGQVTSHGPETTPGTTPKQFQDFFGLFEVPGGIPGVVDVSATGNVVVPSSADCPPGSTGDATHTSAVCKPTTDPHQASGQGALNQLTYFSNYGSRIDVAAPGGARKFNLPVWDRGGTPGFPYTSADLTTVYEDFNITSNFATQIPCFTFTGGGFPANQCYTTIQGTSMATPHASAVVALIASADKGARGHANELVNTLKRTALHVTGNQTQPLSAGDKTPADLSGVACPTGYCHLGGAAIPDSQAYGAGLVDAGRAVR